MTSSRDPIALLSRAGRGIVAFDVLDPALAGGVVERPLARAAAFLAAEDFDAVFLLGVAEAVEVPTLAEKDYIDTRFTVIFTRQASYDRLLVRRQ